MSAEPVPIAPLDDGNFLSGESTTVILGPCRCPGRPHDEDTADVLVELPWDVLVDVGLLSGGAAYRRLVLGSLVSWNLVDVDGDPVEISPAVIGRLRPDRLEPIAAAVNEAYQRARAPLPNASGAPSRRSPREKRIPEPDDPTAREAYEVEVMRVTGWTSAQLRAEPARVIRAHFARIFAGLIWSPDLIRAASGPAPTRGSYGSLADYAAARRGYAMAVDARRVLERALWPEDDDG